MKIICVHQSADMYGSDRSFLQVVNYLSESGDFEKVTVILPRSGPLVTELEKLNVDIIYLKLSLLSKTYLKKLQWGKIIFPLFSFSSKKKLFDQYDVVYVNTSVILDFYLLAPFLKQLKIIHIREIPNSILSKVLSLFLKWSGAKIIFNSYSTLSSFQPLKQSYVVHNAFEGFNQELFKEEKQLAKIFNKEAGNELIGNELIGNEASHNGLNRNELNRNELNHNEVSVDVIIGGESVDRGKTAEKKTEEKKADRDKREEEKTDELEIVQPARPLRILLIGRINTWKGQDFAIESLATIASAPVILKIVGSTSAGNEVMLLQLKKKVENLGLSNRVEFMDFVSDTAKIYAWSDVVIVPSTKPEPFGRIAIEAMSLCKPVIAANHGGLPEIIEDAVSGFLFEPNNKNAFINVLNKYIHDRALLQQHGMNAKRTFEEKFSLSGFYKKLDPIFKDLKA